VSGFPSEEAAPRGRPPGSAAAASADQGRLFRWFFFGAFALLIWQLALVLSLFADIIVWAASLALVCFPVHAFMQRRLPARPQLAAGLSTLVVLVLVLVPLLVLVSIVIRQSAQLYPVVREWIVALQSADGEGIAALVPAPVQAYRDRVAAFLAESPLLAGFDLREYLLARINTASARIAGFGTALARNLLLGMLNVLLVLVMLFFCFRDGGRFLRWLFETVPMPVAHARSIAFRIYTTVTAVVRGALLTAAIQGLLAMLGYLIAGVPLAAFFGVLSGVAAMIPVVGAALVWAPIGLVVYLREPGWGIFVMLWGLLVVSLVDNFLKPVLIGTRARMPILLMFFGIIGGVNVYGVTGVMIGPILMASVLSFVTIYREYYAPGGALSQATVAEHAERPADSSPAP
jgi:predicted PurR-regulated permease PerM